ncbi:MAG: CPBP family glutamic-type intramembrane protease, partial [Candidatus Margulisiibacteriota bacterium]
MKGSHAILYIITVLLLSWIVQIVLFLGILPGKWLIFYMYVPALTAFFFFFIDRKPFSDQIKLFARRISLWSLVFAFGYPIFWLGIVVLMGYVTGLGQINFSFLPALMSFSFWGVFGLTLLTGLPSMFGEEYGWRGYLLPALAEKRNLLASTLILGAVWG